MGEVTEKIGVLRCPRCGNDNPADIVYLEDTLTWRRCLRVEDGVLVISGDVETCDDDGKNHRFECDALVPDGESKRSCYYQWPIPDWLEIDWE